MQCIAIVGNGGSGRTHVGRRLGALLRIPVVHLDAGYHDASRTPASSVRFAAHQRALVAAPAWIIT